MVEEKQRDLKKLRSSFPMHVREKKGKTVLCAWKLHKSDYYHLHEINSVEKNTNIVCSKLIWNWADDKIKWKKKPYSIHSFDETSEEKKNCTLVTRTGIALRKASIDRRSSRCNRTNNTNETWWQLNRRLQLKMQIELNVFFSLHFQPAYLRWKKLIYLFVFICVRRQQREKSVLYRTMGTGYVENRIAGKCYGVCTIKLIEFCGFRLACALESWKKHEAHFRLLFFFVFFRFSNGIFYLLGNIRFENWKHLCRFQLYVPYPFFVFTAIDHFFLLSAFFCHCHRTFSSVIAIFALVIDRFSIYCIESIYFADISVCVSVHRAQMNNYFIVWLNGFGRCDFSANSHSLWFHWIVFPVSTKFDTFMTSTGICCQLDLCLPRT